MGQRNHVLDRMEISKRKRQLLGVVRPTEKHWESLLRAGLKVRGLGGLSPQLLAEPPAQGEWGGRLREGIRERGKW